MNSVDQLKKFLARVTTDEKLTTTHVGFCAALAVTWIEGGYVNSFNISRKRLMQAAKIRSTATYHKIISDLVSYKYITYTPSYHPAKGSAVNIQLDFF